MQKKSFLQCSLSAALAFCFALLLSACWGASAPTVPMWEYAPYVSSYTGGSLSSQATIRVELTQNVASFSSAHELDENPFSFSPRLKGKAYMAAPNIVEFIPDEGEMEYGEYTATFALDQFCSVPERLGDFRFKFIVRMPEFTFTLNPYFISEATPDKAEITGKVTFSDRVSASDALEMVSVKNAHAGYKIDMQPTQNECVFDLKISDLVVGATDYDIDIEINGYDKGFYCKAMHRANIPGKQDFKVVEMRHITSPQNGVEVTFNRPLNKNHNYRGLVWVADFPNLSVQSTGNKITIVFDDKTDKGSYRVVIDEQVKAHDGTRLGKSHSQTVEVPSIKPAVEFKQPAAILPDCEDLTVPFRAVNLYAVDVKVIQVFQNNVLQFFQENSLKSQLYPYAARLVGRPVVKKTIHLAQNPVIDVHKWNDFTLDLSDLFEREPGAIYQIGLSFKKEYSAYPGVNDDRVLNFDERIVTAEELENYEIEMEPYDWDKYDWTQRDNPMTDSYYMNSSLTAVCNVMASNIGITAKSFGAKQLLVAATNLLDATPASGVDVTLYDFQQQQIATASTDGDGFALFTDCGKAYMVVANDGKQKTYLRLSEGENLSVSRFDVGGETISDGLRGFIYGERGVWRPGDTLHITFMLDDREERLPQNHPATLEVFNSRGGLHCKQVNTNGLNGVYSFAVPTSVDDETGRWNAYVKIGSASFHKPLRVETIKPNRLKIDASAPSMIEVMEDVYMPVKSEWLTGAKAAGLRSKLHISLSAAETAFDGYKDFVFDNPTRFTTIDYNPFEIRLDANGQGQYAFHIPAQNNAAGMLNMRLKTEVYEPGGDASYFTETVKFSPYKKYVGVRFNTQQNGYIETDQDHTFDVVTVDSHGKAVDCKNLRYYIYKRTWNWWYDESNSSANYFSGTNEKPVASGKLSTSGGKGSFNFRVDYPEWGRYVVVVKDLDSGHTCGGEVTIDWPNWRGRADRDDPEGAQMLTFSFDKPKYEVGEKATVIIPRTAAGGRALITVETGSNILLKDWIDVSVNNTDTKYSFTVEQAMMPNAYVSISLIQAFNFQTNDMPLRMYGVAPIFAQDAKTILDPQISMPAELEPEKDFEVEISERNGQAMTYTIAIVDEGLLSISNFRTPDPWNGIYKREALGVRTWDMYNDVVDFHLNPITNLFAIGGSDEGSGPQNSEAKRFNPVVKVLGPFSIEKGKKQKHKVRLPMYVGEVRTMVIAKNGGAYGSAQKSTKVSSPLMLLTTLPRVLSVGEEITVPVNVFAMRNDVKNVSVSLKVEGTDASLTSDKQSLSFSQTGDQMAYFKLNTGTQVGKLTFRVDAKSGSYSAYEDLEIEVRNPNPVVTQRQAVAIEGKQSATLSYNVEGSTGTPQIALSLARLAPVDIESRFEFIMRSGYYGTEQITSNAIALLFTKKFKEVSESEQAAIDNRIIESLALVSARQNYDGTFSCWQGSTYSYEWIDTYVGILLSLAKENGYEVNAAVMEKWLRLQTDRAKKAPASVAQAFRLYALALAGKADLSAMNRMKAKEEFDFGSRYMLAAAYAMAGKKNVANEIIDLAATDTNEQADMFSSELRNEAIKLNALALAERKQEAMEQALRLSEMMDGEYYYSSQSNAFALAALARYAQQAASAIDCQWSVAGKAQNDIRTSNALSTNLLPATPAKAEVTVKNNNDGLVYASLTTRTHLVHDTLAAQSNGMNISISYYDDNNRAISPAQISQGTTFRVVVDVVNTSERYIDMAQLTYMLPSGWEVFADQTADGNFLYQDIRDDRALTYFSLGQGRSAQFTLRLQATYEGQYTLPAVLCENVYRPEVNARTAASVTTVVR